MGLKGNSVSKKRKLSKNQRTENINGSMHISYLHCKSPSQQASPLSSLPPFMTIPEACMDPEDVATLLFRRDAPFIVYLLQANVFSNATGRSMHTNLEPYITEKVCTAS